MAWWALGSAWSHLPGTLKLALKGVQEQLAAPQSWQQTVLGRLKQQEGKERRWAPGMSPGTGGAEHHRSAWETSEDATRPGLRRFCDPRVQSAVCVHSNKPRFHVCQVPAVLGHHSLVVTLPLPELSGLCSQSPSGVSPLPAET